MKIALVVHDARPGGGQDRYVLELANRLSETHDVTLFARTTENLASTVTFHPVRAPARPLALLARTFARRARKALSRQQWDIVHCVGGALPGASVVTAQYCHHAWRQAARKWRSELIGKGERIYRAADIRLAMHDERKTARHPALRGLIGVSRRTLDEWRSAYGAAPPVQAVVHNGVDLSQFNPGTPEARRRLRSSLKLPDASKVALLVGALVRKGVETAIWALGPLPDDVHLVAVGAGPKERVLSLAVRAGVSGRVHVVDPVADIERYYAGADMLVFPTRYEPFGMVVAEAWACGLPVVASGVTGATEWATNGDSVLLVSDPTNVQGFAKCMIRILEDAPLAERLSRGGRDLARRLSWERVVADTEAVYEKVLV
ncbi:MAG: glycosyltransferase family 4 protein [Gemmatimonadetes bacterium]|nr:glycosyltransferase family 4 protein [Gemmatimonadota bacterium]